MDFTIKILIFVNDTFIRLIMNFGKIFFSVLTVFVTLSFSCKKKENYDELVKTSFKGNIKFDVPDYLESGSELRIEPYGVSRQDDKGFGIKWVIPELKYNVETRTENDALTNKGELVLSVPDTSGTINISCFVYAEGYYTLKYSKPVKIVNPAKSVRHGKDMTEYETFTDERDKKTYRYVSLGGLDWMIDNLRYGKENLGVPFLNNEAMEKVFGRFYTWEDAVKAVPAGWRLPSASDFDKLASFLGCKKDSESYMGMAGKLMDDTYFNGVRMWNFSPKIKITNESGLYFLPLGFGEKREGAYTFKTTTKYSCLWTAEHKDGSSMAVYKYIVEDNPDMISGYADMTTFAIQVRCVRNSK